MPSSAAARATPLASTTASATPATVEKARTRRARSARDAPRRPRSSQARPPIHTPTAVTCAHCTARSSNRNGERPSACPPCTCTSRAAAAHRPTAATVVRPGRHAKAATAAPQTATAIARATNGRPAAAPSSVASEHAHDRALGQRHDRHTAGAQRPGDREQGLAVGRRGGARHEQRDGGGPDQQEKAPVEQPAPDGLRGRQRGRRGRSAGGGGGGDGGRGGPHGEDERGLGEVAIDARDGAPVHGIGAVGQRARQGDTQFGRMAGDALRRRGAGDDGAGRVEELDRRQTRVGSFGEREDELVRRPGERCTGGGSRAGEQGVGARRRRRERQGRRQGDDGRHDSEREERTAHDIGAGSRAAPAAAA